MTTTTPTMMNRKEGILLKKRKPFIVNLAYLLGFVGALGLVLNCFPVLETTQVAYADGFQRSDLTFEWSGNTREHADLSLRSVKSSKYWDDTEWIVSHNSFYETNEARCAAAGFSDALTFPFEHWNDGDEWGNFFFSEETVRAEIWEELKTNPVYLYAVISYLRDCETRAGGTLGDWNSSWMDHYIDTSDYYISLADPESPNYNPYAELKGWDYWTWQSQTIPGEACVTDEYKEIAILTMSLLDRFTYLGIVDNVNSAESWALNDAIFTDLAKPIKVDYLVTRPAVVFGYERKDSFSARYFGGQGTYDCLIGFDRHDKRPERPGTPEPEKPTVKPTVKPTIKPTPTPTEEPWWPTCPPDETVPPTCRPTPTPTPTATTTCPPPTSEPTPTPTQTCQPTPTPTPVVTATPTPVPTATPTPDPTPTPHPTKDPDQRPQVTDDAPVGGGGTQEGNDKDELQVTPPPKSTPAPEPTAAPAPTPAPTAKPTEKPVETTPKPTPKLEETRPEATKRPEIKEDEKVTEKIEIPDDD